MHGCGTCLEVCPIRYEVQLPEMEGQARTAYAEATDEAGVTEIIDKYREERGTCCPFYWELTGILTGCPGRLWSMWRRNWPCL